MGIEKYSAVAGENLDYFPETMPPSDMNNKLRQFQADAREQHERAEWINLGLTISYVSSDSFTVDGVDVTTAYQEGRRVRATGTTTGTIHGYIDSSSFSTNTTVNVIWDGDQLQNEDLVIDLGILSSLGHSLPKSVDRDRETYLETLFFTGL